MTQNQIHPLTAAGLMLTGWGAAIVQYLPTLVGFALTLLGLWLQRQENRRHERALSQISKGRP